MDKVWRSRTRRAVLAGMVLLLAGRALREFTNQEWFQIVLIVPTFLAVGVLAAGVRRGFVLAFLLTVVFVPLDMAVFDTKRLWENLRDIYGALAWALVFVGFSSVIAGILGGIGGFIGRKVLR